VERKAREVVDLDAYYQPLGRKTVKAAVLQ
jgi:hypothetical protein